MPTLHLPTLLRPYAGGQAEVSVPGPTVGAALTAIVARYPALRQHLFEESGELRAYVNLFRNTDDVRELQGLDTPLADSDRLRVIPSIAGG